MSSKKDVFKDSKRVRIERPAISAVALKQQAEGTQAAKEKGANAIVRFRNYQDTEIGRVDQENAA